MIGWIDNRFGCISNRLKESKEVFKEKQHLDEMETNKLYAARESLRAAQREVDDFLELMTQELLNRAE